MEGLVDTLSKLSVQDLAAIGVVVLAVTVCIVCIPCYLLLVTVTGLGPRWAKSACAHALRSVKRPSRFNYHQIIPRLFLGSLPRTFEDLERLKAEGVGAMVTLNEVWEMALSTRFVREECGLDHLHVPTPDFFAPRQADIEAAVQFMTERIAKGIGVYVHCNGGKGRSVVCVLAYLVSAEGQTPEEAFDLVASKRKVAPMRGSFGMHKQWRAVKRYAQGLPRTRKAPFEAFKDEAAPIDNVGDSPKGNTAPCSARDLVVNVAAEGRTDEPQPENPKPPAALPLVSAPPPVDVPPPGELTELTPRPEGAGKEPKGAEELEVPGPSRNNTVTGSSPDNGAGFPVLEASFEEKAPAASAPECDEGAGYDEGAEYESDSQDSEEEEPPLLE